MWKRSGIFVIKNRLILLICLFAATGLMGYFASKVKLSYEFARAIPVDNPKYQTYLDFKKKFGDDGNLLVVGVQMDSLFQLPVFNAYADLSRQLKNIAGVEDVLSVPMVVSLRKDSLTQKISAQRVFADSMATQGELDSAVSKFYNLPFYRNLLYNPDTHAYLIGVRINKDLLASAKRSRVVAEITKATDQFAKQANTSIHLSGLPLIRTVVSDRIQQEMKFFLLGSLLFSALILLLFFRSFNTMLLSLLVVIFGVIWSIGILYLCGYKISLLTALIPSLVVVIGIPNCIYFINKYHTSYLRRIPTTPDSSQTLPSTALPALKNEALVEMVSKMGVVTLFCNITAAIGFAVFALTKSAVLKEFGVVAGISIMIIFFTSFILLPAVLSYLPLPNASQTKYLNNRWLINFLVRIERWVLHNKTIVSSVTVIVLAFAIIGIFKLKSVAYIVDDLPKTDKIYTDLKFFEHHFKGIMPLEIVIDTKKPNGLRRPGVFERVDSLSKFISAMPETNRPLSVAEGFKFFYQGFSEGDSTSYAFPNEAIIAQMLRELNTVRSSDKKDGLSKMLLSFMDSSMQNTRISVSMADVGTKQLPGLIDSIQQRIDQLFDSTHYTVHVTGTSITFQEGSRFIVNGLKESILWAFLFIACCMLYLFRSVRILLCSLIPNLIPLVITAGIMGWIGVPLKPSTVLIFSVALGIAIDITIRFLVNYKQELPEYNNDVIATVSATIKNTGLSIVYTSLVLIAGFVIFCGSSFGGTKALGWLTSVTLLVATMTNLVLLPVLLLLTQKKSKANAPRGS